MEENVFPTILMDTTCRTQGCVNENITHRIHVMIGSDNIMRVICGTCSQAVTDLVEVHD